MAILLLQVMEHGEVALAAEADEENSDAEDDHILPTDSILVVAYTQDECSYLDVQVLDESGNLYVHHDLALPGKFVCATICVRLSCRRSLQIALSLY
jgi:hypothetical protein